MLNDDLNFFNFDGKTFKYATYSNNCIKFYSEIDPILSGENVSTPLFSIDLPAEEFLDQMKTEFVENFSWSILLYPNSTDPNLNGKPVFVLAVKTNANSTIKYSFVDMALLSDVKDVKNADGTSLVAGGIASIPKATNNMFGVIKPDGSTIIVDDNGVAHSGMTIHTLPVEILGRTFNNINDLISASNTALDNGNITISSTYYGGIYTNGMIPKADNTYFSGNVEVQMTVVGGTLGSAVYLYEIVSVTDSPYLWTCYAVEDGRNTGWIMHPTWNDLKAHKEQSVNSEVGAHNIRYYNNTLQYFDDGSWITLNIGNLLL